MPKKIFVPLMLLVLSAVQLSLTGCSSGSAMSGTGNIIDRSIEIDGFTRVNIPEPVTVEIKQGTTFEVVISTDDNLISRIVVSRKDETLNVAIQAPGNFFPTSLKLTITMPRIYSLTLSKAAKANLSGFASTFNFALDMSEGSILSGYLEAGICTFDVTGGSQVNLTGQAIELELNSSGASKLDLENFPVPNVRADLREGSQAVVNVAEKLDAILADASTLVYAGTPVIGESSISSGSSMRQK